MRKDLRCGLFLTGRALFVVIGLRPLFFALEVGRVCSNPFALDCQARWNSVCFSALHLGSGTHSQALLFVDLLVFFVVFGHALWLRA